MDLLIISDSHGRAGALRAAAKQLNFRPDAVLFLGDGLRDMTVFDEFVRFSGVPVLCVAGNCDFFHDEQDSPTERDVWFGDKKIRMLHGHTARIYDGSAAVQRAALEGVDAILSGHSHVAYEETLPAGHITGEVLLHKPLLLANPGSIGQPRDGGAPSFGVLTIRNGQMLFSVGRLEDRI